MRETVHASFGVVDLDLDKQTWSSAATLPEGEFPFVVELSGKRLELYSDGTFDEVERDASR